MLISKVFLKLFVVISCLILLLTSNTTMAKVLDESKEQAHKVILLLNQNKLEKAKILLDEAIYQSPNATPILYQMARYNLKVDTVKEDSIIGFRYSILSENGAVYLLQKVLKLDPEYGDAYSLLGHIYAVQNNIQEAEKHFSKAIALPIRPVWLNYNMALLAIQKKEFGKAVKLLRKHTSRYAKLPSSKAMQDTKASIYSASWDTLKRLVIKYPKYDPVQGVRDGLIKRVNADDFVEFMKNKKHDKDTFVHFSSSDENCNYCIENNKKIEKLAQKNHKKIDFIRVSFEPWNDLKYYNRSLAKPITISTVPTQVVFQKGQPSMYKSSLICDCDFDQMLSGSFQKIIPSRYDAKKPDVSNVQESLEYYFQNYLAADKDYKAYAVAVAVDGQEWLTGFSRKNLSQKYANKKALQLCEQARKNNKIIKNSCQLYAVGDKRVFDIHEDEIQKVTNELEQQELSPLDKYVTSYKNSKPPKTLAISVDKFQRWNSFYLYTADVNDDDCRDMQACKKRVLKTCNKNREKVNNLTPCQIYYENDKEVKKFILPKFY